VNFVSLFSGCGGLDLGFERAGFNCLLAVESEPLFAHSYSRNFPAVPVAVKKVEALDRSTIEHFAPSVTRLQIDLVVGGPPCPPFSKSRFYRLEKPRALDDPSGLSTLVGFMDVVRTLQPVGFVLENVHGLAYDVHRGALDLILQTGTRLGYRCAWKVLNAADYGVPQIRERCFVVGLRGPREFEFPEPSHSKQPSFGADGRLLSPWLTAGDVLADLDLGESDSDEGHFAGGAHHDLLTQIPPGDNYLYFTERRGCREPKFEWRSRYWSFLLKLSPDLPSWTIQARRSNNMGPFHWRNRILKIEEVKRLQSFPDNWQLAGTVEQQWRQLGNAVPPLLARAIGDAIARQLSALAAPEAAERSSHAVS
jgi:DNA (cytosine-5)-methyltransferase 1